ncbi:hypothetical protein [Pandoraea communis]|uniref:hypothetical protein n=1 Tax=Pandoraea communis TaxID=2508297 RepID=UPI0025A62691|nr:hypothetical protein [Pandoraea communis]MDM8355857.1 hypothetical protein [Pandoraea communis]
MKIDSGITNSLVNRMVAGEGNARANMTSSAASFRAVLAGRTQASGEANGTNGTSDASAQQTTRQTNFAEMTRQQMRDWLNDQIRGGQMSLDDSAPFMAMTMKIPVGGNSEVPAEGDPERINFMERARLGIEGALSLGDPKNAQRLQAALDIMTRRQGETVGISTHA